MPRDQVGQHLGYLPQDVELFEGSVAENIARLDVVDAEKVVAAAKDAGLHDLILHLPEGYDTPLGPGGRGLSPGQRQRIGLARALYGAPKLVVLDEPNSSLDETGDAALISAIQSLKASGATVVMITHRTNALAVADKMLILQDGQMQAFGPRDTVLQAIQEAAKKHAEQARALAAQNKAVPNLAGPAAIGGAA
jgi:ATP-binding cassette subfamily C exporter for protease/lipase